MNPADRVAYSKGYNAGRRREREIIAEQYVLNLNNGGQILIRGTHAISAAELSRIRGWIAQQLIILPETPKP